jgi:hypothetical protein
VVKQAIRADLNYLPGRQPVPCPETQEGRELTSLVSKQNRKLKKANRNLGVANHGQILLARIGLFNDLKTDISNKSVCTFHSKKYILQFKTNEAFRRVRIFADGREEDQLRSACALKSIHCQNCHELDVLALPGDVLGTLVDAMNVFKMLNKVIPIGAAMCEQHQKFLQTLGIFADLGPSPFTPRAKCIEQANSQSKAPAGNGLGGINFLKT